MSSIRSAAFLAALLLALGSWTITAAGQEQKDGKPLEGRVLSKTGRSATAYVEVSLPGRGIGSGSAFCVHASGLFVTNNHVVKSAGGPVRLVMHPGTPEQKIYTAKVLRADDANDLALLQVNEKAEFAAIKL